MASICILGCKGCTSTLRASFYVLIISISVSDFLRVTSSSQPCSNYNFTSGRFFNSCTDLPYLNAHLHWNYDPSHRRVEIAYRASRSHQGWIAWGINPTGSGMVGTQALVAFMSLNGSMTAYTTPITSYEPSMLPGELSFPVSHISAEYSNHQMIIYAVFRNRKMGTKFNHVWQTGSSVSENIPQMHSTSPPHLRSTGKFDLHLHQK